MALTYTNLCPYVTLDTVILKLKNNTYSRAERAKLQEAIFDAEKFDALAEDWADHVMDVPPIEQVVLPRFGQIRPGVLGFTQVIDLTKP